MKKSKFLFALRLSLIPLSIFGMFFVPSLKIAIVLLATLTAVLAYPFWQKFKTQRALVVAVALTFFLIGSKILITESATNKTVKNNSTAVDGLIDDYLRDSLSNDSNVVGISLPPDSSVHIDGLPDGTYSIVVPVNDSALSKILK